MNFKGGTMDKIYTGAGVVSIITVMSVVVYIIIATHHIHMTIFFFNSTFMIFSWRGDPPQGLIIIFC